MKRMSRWVLRVSAAGPLPYGRGSVTKHTAPDRAATVREQLAGLIREIRKLVSPSLLTTLCRWAALAAGLVLLRSVTLPDLPLCGFRWLTGRPCPLCGLTRAVFALAKGHWAEALHWHALSPLAVVMLAALLWNPPRLARLWMPCVAAFGVYGVWRIVF